MTRDIIDNKDGGNNVYVKIEKEGLETIERMSRADENGVFEFEIPTTYKDASIRIHIRHPWYKSADTNGLVQEYGFFHTAKIVSDFFDWKDSGSLDPEWQSEKEFSKAQEIKNERVRSFRHKNFAAKTIHYTVLIGAPFLGLIAAGPYGVIIGLLVSFALEFWSPYSSGLRKIWK